MNESFNSTYCRYNTYSFPRYVFIVYVGTPFAFLGIFTNILLVHIFRGRRNCASPTLYFIVLAILDIAICAMYIILFSFDALAIYHRLETLWRLWMAYAMAVLTLSRIVQIASTYIVVAATVERFCFVSNLRYLTKPYFTTKQRGIAVGAILLFASALRAPTYFEYYVDDKPECRAVDTLAAKSFEPLLVNSSFYSDVYNFYFMHVVQVFLPFAALVVLNITIVYQLHRQLRFAKKFLFFFLQKFVFQQINENSVSKQQIRSATSSLVAMVSIYLICNSLHVLLSILEHAAKVPLLEDENGSTSLYDYLTDIICFLFMFNSFLRLFIYMTCNYDLRKLVLKLVCKKFPRMSTTLCDHFNQRRKSRASFGFSSNDTTWPMLHIHPTDMPRGVPC